ncbi:MAG: hypothetical protein K2K29_07155 [Muribaculaceae bacterium]|nr:hypothetical protein [Muribaculaceae bacterium]
MKYTLILSLMMILGISAAKAGDPLDVNAADLVGKVYGVADASANRNECRLEAGERFGYMPANEDGAEWINSTDGFAVRYSGMAPEADAMARYDGNKVAGYGYIFYFPYEAYARKLADSAQCEFCSTLLQELTDMAISMCSDPMTDAIFDMSGDYNGNDISLTLREEIDHETITPDQLAGSVPADRCGRFVLLVSIVPDAYPLTASLSE